MLNCQEVAARASALIDGELSTWEAFRMQLHLAMCRGCGRFIKQMRTTRDLTEIQPGATTHSEADSDRISAILSRLHEENPKSG